MTARNDAWTAREAARKATPRPITLNSKALTLEEMREGAELYNDEPVPRPKTRGDCRDGIRPCPWVSCRYHLFLDVAENGRALKLNFPHLDVTEMRDSCALDVSERGGLDWQGVAEMLNVSHERARQIHNGLAPVLREAFGGEG